MDNREIKPAESGSYLGPSFQLSGHIETAEDLTVEGKIEGELIVNGHKLLVGRSATIKGNIKAQEVIVEGSIAGNIQATTKVTLTSQAKLEGDILAARVSIEEGARFKGAIKIRSS